jgi:hypothetical protein
MISVIKIILEDDDESLWSKGLRAAKDYATQTKENVTNLAKGVSQQTGKMYADAGDSIKNKAGSVGFIGNINNALTGKK